MSRPKIRSDSRTGLAELRRRIAVMEGRLPSERQLGPAPASSARKQGPAPTSTPLPEPERLGLGLDELDRLFAAGGLSQGALHELVSAESRNAGAVSGLVCALLARIMAIRPGMVLWVLDPLAAREAGQFHGPGLVRFGIDPARLVTVLPRKTEELLWAMEEGARCAALAAVVGEVQGVHKALDLTATRRLLLRAQGSGVPTLLVRHGASMEPTAALSRWHAEPRPSHEPDLPGGGPHEGVGPPVWHVDLNRNRDGRPGRLDLEWSHAARDFSAPAHSLPVVCGSSLRPDSAPVDGAGLENRENGENGSRLVAFPTGARG